MSDYKRLWENCMNDYKLKKLEEQYITRNIKAQDFIDSRLMLTFREILQGMNIAPPDNIEALEEEYRNIITNQATERGSAANAIGLVIQRFVDEQTQKNRRGGKRRKKKTRRKPIRINPKMRGVFTKKAKRKGMSVQKYAKYIVKKYKGKNKTKRQLKLFRQALFAKTAKKWKKRRTRKKRGGMEEPKTETPGRRIISRHHWSLWSKGDYLWKPGNPNNVLYVDVKDWDHWFREGEGYENLKDWISSNPRQVRQVDVETGLANWGNLTHKTAKKLYNDGWRIYKNPNWDWDVNPPVVVPGEGGGKRRKKKTRKKTMKAGASSSEKERERRLHSSVQLVEQEQQVITPQQQQQQQQQVLEEEIRDLEARINVLQDAIQSEQHITQAELDDTLIQLNNLTVQLLTINQHIQQNQQGGRKKKTRKKR